MTPKTHKAAERLVPFYKLKDFGKNILTIEIKKIGLQETPKMCDFQRKAERTRHDIFLFYNCVCWIKVNT